MNFFVQVVVNIPAISGVFDYSIPASLTEAVGVGHLVIVPFGKQTVQGVILRFIDQPSVQIVKDVLELVDSEPVLTQEQIELAEEMAKSTLAPLAAVIGLFLPIGLNQQVDTLYELRKQEVESKGKENAPGSADQNTKRQTIEDRILGLLRLRGPLRGRQIDSH
jgi:primosomal protein N' (replication factor Y)